MDQTKLQRLHKLETLIEQLKIKKAKASQELTVLRTQRTVYLNELKELGINPVQIKEQLQELHDSIEHDINKIDNLIPPNLAEFIQDDPKNSNN